MRFLRYGEEGEVQEFQKVYRKAFCSKAEEIRVYEIFRTSQVTKIVKLRSSAALTYRPGNTKKHALYVCGNLLENVYLEG
jgi:hypothetical protein